MPGSVIKKYREMRNYSQKFVSSQMNISQNAYSKIENNLTQLTVHHVKEISRILDVPVMDLLNDNFEIHKPISIPRVVAKNDLVSQSGRLQKLLQNKISVRHDSYIVAMSLMVAAESALISVD